MTRVAALWSEWAAEDGFADPLSPSFGTMSLGAVTFPTSPLTTRVYIALGADLTASHLTWNWLDITGYVRHDLGISVVFGRRDEFTKVTSSRCQLKLENIDGRFSRRKASGPYYGLLSRNTPIWIQVNPGSGYVDQYHGYVNDWPNRWSDESGNDSYVVIQCAGVMRRLGQGESAQQTLNATILADNPTYYWRLDDSADSTVGASSLPNGGKAMTVVNTIGWRLLESPPGGDGKTSAAQFNDGYTYAVHLDVAPPWTVEWSILRPADDSLNGVVTFQINFLVGGVPNLGTFTVTLDTDVSARDWYHFKATGTQNGANWEINYWKNGIAKGVGFSGVGTLGNLTTVTAFGGIPGGGASSVAYVGVYAHTNVDAGTHSGALQAFAGEMAHERIARLCGEAGVPIHTTAARSAIMGPQPSGTLMDVLRQCETADQGVLYEHQYGFGYQSLDERYNQPVVFALDFDQRHIGGLPEPADDDQRIRNEWTIGRPDSITRATARNQDSVDADGLYDDADTTVRLETDAQLAPHAGWRVHVGTVDEDRWPRLPLKLHGTPDLIPGWTATKLGDRITVANPPAQMAPDTIDAIVEGWQEHWDTVQWNVSLNTSPASPYQVGSAGGDSTAGRWAQTSGTELAADIDSTATSFNVNITAGPLWTTSPGGQLIIVGGEVMALNSVSGASSPQTFGVTRSVNGVVKAHTITSPAKLRAVRVYRPLIASL